MRRDNRQARGDAAEIADAVAVRILKAAGVNLIDDTGLPPLRGKKF